MPPLKGETKEGEGAKVEGEKRKDSSGDAKSDRASKKSKKGGAGFEGKKGGFLNQPKA